MGVNRIQALVSRMFTVALDPRLIDAHPAARIIKRFQEPARSRADRRGTPGGSGPASTRTGAASDAVRLRCCSDSVAPRRPGCAGPSSISSRHLDAAAAAHEEHSRTRRAAADRTRAAEAATRKTAEHDEPRVFPGLTLTCDEHRALSADPRRRLRVEGPAANGRHTPRRSRLRRDDDRARPQPRVTVTAKHYNQHRYVDEIRRRSTAWDLELQRILRNEPKPARASCRCARGPDARATCSIRRRAHGKRPCRHSNRDLVAAGRVRGHRCARTHRPPAIAPMDARLIPQPDADVSPEHYRSTRGLPAPTRIP